MQAITALGTFTRIHTYCAHARTHVFTHIPTLVVGGPTAGLRACITRQPTDETQGRQPTYERRRARVETALRKAPTSASFRSMSVSMGAAAT